MKKDKYAAKTLLAMAAIVTFTWAMELGTPEAAAQTQNFNMGSQKKAPARTSSSSKPQRAKPAPQTRSSGTPRKKQNFTNWDRDTRFEGRGRGR